MTKSLNDDLTKHQRYYRSHKEKYKEKGKKYYQRNKERIKAWKKEYRQKNRDFLLKLRKVKRDKLSGLWRQNAVPKSYKIAEDIILEKILPTLGFKEIFRPTKNFYFDSLAIREEKIYAIEVATTQAKQLSPYRISFCKFFKIDLIVFFVKPDLSCYYMVEQKYPDYRTNPWYKQGKKIELVH